MMDETIANTHPSNWQKVRELEGDLINSIGNPAFRHEVVDPIPCLREMTRQLQGKEFSSVIDLTGWLTPAIRELFPSTPIENRFSLSRVRVVSSPNLATTGYRVSMPPSEIEEVRTVMDLRKTLILDDVSFSGWTSRKTMDILGVNPEDVTHAFLIANTGDLGKDPGAVPMLESIGSKVILGKEIKTPQDDGWHLKDLHQNPNLEQSFILSLLFQEAVGKHGLDSDIAQKFFEHETVIGTVFPDHVTSEQIRNLMGEGRFILKDGNVINGNEVHARNPFLWASPYFQEHIDINKTLQNKDKVVSILSELRALTSDPEGRREASLELRREVQRMKAFRSVEGQFGRGRERI